MKKLNYIIFIVLLAKTNIVSSAIYNVEFQVNITQRQTVVNGNWVSDKSYTGEKFNLTVRFDSVDYISGGPFVYPGSNRFSYHPGLTPIEIGKTPFDDEFSHVTPTLDYGDRTISEYSYIRGAYSQNHDFGTESIFHEFYSNEGIYQYREDGFHSVYYNRTNIVADIKFHDFISPINIQEDLTLEDFLNLLPDKDIGFSRTVLEYYNLCFGPYECDSALSGTVLLDGGIKYRGNASIIALTTVPLPASFWLFSIALISLNRLKN